MQKIKTAPSSEWRPIETVSPGHKVLLHTDTGTAVIGHYHVEGGYLAWAPLPKRPEWLKEKMQKSVSWGEYLKLDSGDLGLVG